MISPELAKQLKDAGWPQDHDCIDGKQIGDLIGGCLCIPMQPTLEELIEACGSKNFQLTADANGTWTAQSFITATSGTGSTPEEATARLWLAHDHTKL
jgi:hypothetical protein